MIVPEGVFTPGDQAYPLTLMLRFAARHWSQYTELPLATRMWIETSLLPDLQTIATRWATDGAKADTRARRAVSNSPGRIGTAEAAEILDRSGVWVRERARRGDFNAVKDGGSWSYDADMVLAEAE